MEILIAERLCRQPEHYAADRADDRFAVFAVAAEIFQIAAAPDGFHERIQHHHRFRADAEALLIDRTAVGAGVSVPDLLAVAAVPLRMVAVQKAGDLDR